MTKEELRDYVEEQRNLNMIPYHVYSTLIDGIDTLEVPTGKWLQDKQWDDCWECSVCGRTVDGKRFVDITETYPYCHCGAKMIGRVWYREQQGENTDGSN